MPYGQCAMVYFDPPIKEIIIFQHIKVKCSRNFRITLLPFRQNLRLLKIDCLKQIHVMGIFDYFDDNFNFDQSAFDLDQSKPVDEYEGYNRREIQEALYNIFSDKCPVRIRKDIPDEILNQIPFLNLSECLFHHVEKSGFVKLTKRGHLPVKLVSELYEKKFITEPFVEEGLKKLYKEEDSMAINVCHLVLLFAGLIKKRKDLLSVTANGKKTISSRIEFLRTVMQTFALRFNWASLDGYGNSRTAQFGFGFTLLMLNKYGTEFKPVNFYSDKYMIAFPALLVEFIENSIYNINDVADSFTGCFEIRTFERYLELFNLVEVTYHGNIFRRENIMVKPSKIFHEVFEFDV